MGNEPESPPAGSVARSGWGPGLTRGLAVLSSAALGLSVTGLVAMTAVIGWQVYGRYVLNDTPPWSEQLSLLLMLYYILLAAAVGVREQSHLGLLFFRDRLPAPLRRLTMALSYGLVGAFGGFLAWYGSNLVATTWSHTLPSLGLPTGVSYLPFPAAGVLIVLFSLENLLKALFAPGAEATP
ncbi:MAG: TRAP transporter small permease [Candidatus Competibacterales bacterium]